MDRNMKENDLRNQIGTAIGTIFYAHGFPLDLVSLMNSYGDTLDDEDVLQLLKDFIASGRIINEQPRRLS